MGGRGSGRWPRLEAKPTVEDRPVLNISRLARGGILRPGNSGTISWNDRETFETAATIRFRVFGNAARMLLQLSYRAAGESVSFPICILTTTPHFGGTRWWFRCPLIVSGVKCERRVSCLYLRGKYFGCRSCLGLTYPTAQVAHKFRYFVLQRDRITGWDFGAVVTLDNGTQRSLR